ncbi:MAG: hypothetical protein WCA13_18040 [Terriglobales bacterium]
MKRSAVSIRLGVCVVLAALVCPQLRAQDNKAQDIKAQTKKPAPAPMKLNVGDTAPDFKMQYFDGSDLKEVFLSQYRGKSNVVLAFYIFAFTGG